MISFQKIKYLSCFFLIVCLAGCQSKVKKPIDREALVQRHIPVLRQIDSLSPFSVGNGEFAFTIDATGLQTFPEYYEDFIPLCTQSQWGWHSFPNPQQYTLEQAFEWYDIDDRKIPYASKQQPQAAQWLRANPHRLNLGRIGFQILKDDGKQITINDLSNINQHANIWTGIIESLFSAANHNFKVETTCHPQQDQITARINSSSLATGKVSIRFDFPYAAFSWGKKTADWDSPEKHITRIITHNKQSIFIERLLDNDRYYVLIEWKGKAHFHKRRNHHFLLTITEDNQFEFSVHFSKEKIKTTQINSNTFAASRRHWKNFWQSGAAVDFSECKDPRAFELERRVILSRYLTAIQCAGSLPPSETGLTYNSWYGKFHLEMHWWHGVHFILWGKPGLFEKSMNWYNNILPMAREKARRQGYAGVRWPKMVAFDGRESPSTIGVFLIWQQVHPIFYAELLYRQNPTQKTLDQYKEIVFESAQFMASYARWDAKNKRYILGPPLIPAQEIYKPMTSINPAFELSYWKFGLQCALQWRERLGLGPVERWQNVLDHLSALPQNNGLYQNAENAMDTFTNNINRNDHPTVLASYGMLNNKDVDVAIMRQTLQAVINTWNWENTWGWDYPLIAMTAARVGKPEKAVDALLLDVPKNTYLNNGHNWQRENLTVYLPGNGALLCAVAMMAAGWDGAVNIYAPGFPKNGQWQVKYEGLDPLP